MDIILGIAVAFGVFVLLMSPWLGCFTIIEMGRLTG